MTIEFARVASLLLATVVVGTIAGVMFLYANTIMPGLGKTDDRTFVGSFQAIDTAIINPLFLLAFLGGLILTGLTTVLHFGEEHSSVLPWITRALVVYLLAVVITVTVNVPLNNAIKAAGDPDGIDDLALVRSEFNEQRWKRWNLVRTLLTFAAFACLVWASMLSGGT